MPELTIHNGRRVDVRSSEIAGGSWFIWPPDEAREIGPFLDMAEALDVAADYFAYPLCPHGEPGPDECAACIADEVGTRAYERARDEGLHR